MSGNRQEIHPHLCWNCGKRGAPGVGSRMTCLECDVTWMPWSATARGDPNHVFWMGRLIACVDFTKPEALGAPALTKRAAGLSGWSACRRARRKGRCGRSGNTTRPETRLQSQRHLHHRSPHTAVLPERHGIRDPVRQNALKARFHVTRRRPGPRRSTPAGREYVADGAAVASSVFRSFAMHSVLLSRGGRRAAR